MAMNLTPDQLKAQIDAFAAVLVAEIDKDYSMIKDEDGETCGIWLKDPDYWLFDANERDMRKRLTRLRSLAIKHKLSQDVFTRIVERRYRIVPNASNNTGGSYLMLGSALAPGEKKPWWKFW
jgi:hypothetical protein